VNDHGPDYGFEVNDSADVEYATAAGSTGTTNSGVLTSIRVVTHCDRLLLTASGRGFSLRVTVMALAF